MSDVGDYLVTADKDPVEALKIVHRSATSMPFQLLPSRRNAC